MVTTRSSFLDSVYYDKKLFFSINKCIPNTDVGGNFAISVSNKGKMEIKDVDQPYYEYNVS